MGKIRLDSRLNEVAAFVRKNSVVADIGTDHAYLLAYLLQEGIISRGIAADLRQGPLDNAKRTLIDCGQLERVSLVLSDGLDRLRQGDCDDIVIAGMGGILIRDILQRTPWVYNSKIRIIAQPMSHAEVLRRFFAENGFKIIKESAATDGRHSYCIILAEFDGVKRTAEGWYTYIGELYKNSDEVSRTYINKVVLALEKKLAALKAAGINDSEGLETTVNEIKKRITEV
ncbi:MAG: SAM-dependent methyltransferase [Ruminococcaceae bacterium]|nr:SAM-dependent methyltransferase [Oscillospiraceae bacterium]